MHGGLAKTELATENIEALKKVMTNLAKHIENIQKFGLPIVVAINAFPNETENDIQELKALRESKGTTVSNLATWAKGVEDANELNQKVIEATEKPSNFQYMYDVNDSIKDKINAIATKIYGADGVNYTSAVEKTIAEFEAEGLDKMPICMAKTQYSLSDDQFKLGAPTGFKITVRELRISAGAGFIVALTGNILTMPGLPKKPAAENMDIDINGKITGLF